MLIYVLILTAVIVSYCIGFITGLGSDIGSIQKPVEVKEKKKVGFALHPENIRKKPQIAKEDIGIVEYKTEQELREERDISKRQEEAEMTKSLAKHFPIKTDEYTHITSNN